MLSFIGTNQTLVQIVAQVERVKLAGDGASYVTSSKTITDHALSMATGADCKIFNVVKGSSVCATRVAETTLEASAKPMTEARALPVANATVESVAGISGPPADPAAGGE